MNPLKLIVENDIYDYDIILEQENPSSPKFFKIRGPYIVVNQKNANGRVYDAPMMERSVNEFVTEMVDSGRALGELNHPDHTEIDPQRVCHRITSLQRENDQWIGESIVLSSSPDGTIKGTPCGDILAAILQHGGKPGMSTRGVGNIDDGGLVNEYKLITVDSVSSPSGPGCFVDGILESRNFMINTHGDIVEGAYASFQNGLSNLPSHGRKIYVEELLRKFIEAI